MRGTVKLGICGGQRELAKASANVVDCENSVNAVDCENSVYVVDSEN